MALSSLDIRSNVTYCAICHILSKIRGNIEILYAYQIMTYFETNQYAEFSGLRMRRVPGCYDPLSRLND